MHHEKIIGGHDYYSCISENSQAVISIQFTLSYAYMRNILKEMEWEWSVNIWGFKMLAIQSVNAFAF